LGSRTSPLVKRSMLLPQIVYSLQQIERYHTICLWFIQMSYSFRSDYELVSPFPCSKLVTFLNLAKLSSYHLPVCIHVYSFFHILANLIKTQIRYINSLFLTSRQPTSELSNVTKELLTFSTLSCHPTHIFFNSPSNNSFSFSILSNSFNNVF